MGSINLAVIGEEAKRRLLLVAIEVVLVFNSPVAISLIRFRRFCTRRQGRGK